MNKNSRPTQNVFFYAIYYYYCFLGERNHFGIPAFSTRLKNKNKKMPIRLFLNRKLLSGEIASALHAVDYIMRACLKVPTLAL